jgi:hypothetical protein
MKRTKKLKSGRKAAKSMLLVGMLPPEEFLTIVAEYMARPPRAFVYDFERKYLTKANPIWLYWQW